MYSNDYCFSILGVQLQTLFYLLLSAAAAARGGESILSLVSIFGSLRAIAMGKDRCFTKMDFSLCGAGSSLER